MAETYIPKRTAQERSYRPRQIGPRKLRAQLPKNPDLSKLCKRLVWARQCKRYSAWLIVKYMGVPRKTLQNWEEGRRAIPYWMVRKLCFLYECDILWVVEGEGRGTPPKRPTFVDHCLDGDEQYEERFRKRWLEMSPMFDNELPDVALEKQRRSGK